MSKPPTEKWLREKADAEDKFGPVTAGDMSEPVHLFERGPCLDCPDGQLWSESGPTGKNCPTCNGSPWKYINKIAEAARWVLKGGECAKCEGSGKFPVPADPDHSELIPEERLETCFYCCGKRRFGPEDVRVASHWEDGSETELIMTVELRGILDVHYRWFLQHDGLQRITFTAPDGRTAKIERSGF